MKSLEIFDLDQTLFFTHTQPVVAKIDGKWCELSQSDLRSCRDKITDYDWATWRCDKEFHLHAIPNQSIIKIAIDAINRPNTDVVIITGRLQPTNFDRWVTLFHKHGIAVSRQHFVFVGDENPNFERTTAEVKRDHYIRLINSRAYSSIALYEDCVDNINAFVEAAQIYGPVVTTTAFFINTNGHPEIAHHS